MSQEHKKPAEADRQSRIETEPPAAVRTEIWPGIHAQRTEIFIPDPPAAGRTREPAASERAPD